LNFQSSAIKNVAETSILIENHYCGPITDQIIRRPVLIELKE